MRSRLVLGTAALLALAACHRHRADDEAPAVDNGAVETPLPVAPPPVANETMVEPPKPAKVAAPPKAAPVSEEQQMSEDADASGLTARVDRGADDGDAPKDETTQPAVTSNAD